MISISSPPRPRSISRIQAFRAQGVSLSFPERSWSGVRRGDRSVVIAMREAHIREHADGYRCLLWSAAFSENGEWLDRPSRLERLQHCRLAALRGAASGLITHGAAQLVERDVVVGLRVVAHGDGYWATWGRLARAQRAPLMVPARAAMCGAPAYC